MKNIVILGAGTGGALISNLLTHKLDLREWQITVIDQSLRHIYQPGLLFLPFKLYGYELERDVVEKITHPLPPQVKLVTAQIKAIDHQRRQVETDVGTIGYDYLVSALGCRVAPEEIEGLDEVLGNNGVHTFYTLPGALGMQEAMAQMKEGRLVIDICEMPIKCPVAPLEFAFLADYYFRQKGVRDKIDISLVTPYTGAFTKPNANRVLSQVAQEKGIRVVPNFATSSVDGAKKTLTSFDGRTLEYELLAVIPPNVGADVIEEAGLGDGSSYLHTDPRTLKARKAEHIYAIGDNTNVSTSKAGSVAHFEAETVVENLLREIDGKAPLASFDGHANCFIETGHHKAMLLDFNYDIEPLEGSFPLPYGGPFSLLRESYMNHVGKIAFKWVYWNLLLLGRLPHVPLLPSHLSFMGKDVSGAPQMRHASAMHVGDVMSTNVFTVRQGSSLVDAAHLMLEHKVSGLPVVDVEGQLIGILTEADLLSAMDLTHSKIGDVLESVLRKRRVRKGMGTIVDDLMTPNPITIHATDTLQEAVQRMSQHRIKRLVVTDETRRVQGLVARADLIKLFTMK